MGRKRRARRDRTQDQAPRPLSRRQRVLVVVSEDNTFAQRRFRGEELWFGKCLMCGTKVLVSLEGDLLGGATLEHIEPRNHGGTDDTGNLAIACARCNHSKGARLDNRSRGDQRRQEVVAQLLDRKRSRHPDA